MTGISPEVRFRQFTVQVADDEIVGICLAYTSRDLAITVANALTAYITSLSGRKKLRVEFEREGPQTVRLDVDVHSDAGQCSVSIGGIEEQYVDSLVRALDRQAYYILAVGYEEAGELSFFPDGEGRLFKADVIVYGRVVKGKGENRIDWSAVARALQ